MGDVEQASVINEILEKSPDISNYELSGYGSDVVVFISLDLTNSTKFKNKQPILWKKVISTFYDVVFETYGVNQYQALLKNLRNEINVEFWKFVGDEVLLYANVYNRIELYDVVKSTDEAVKKIIELISKKLGKFYGCERICSESNYSSECPVRSASPSSCKMDDILKTSLGVKATAWLALCGKNDESRNIIHVTSSATEGLFQNKTFDFLGPEIDEGFRIAKYAVKNRVVVSPFLAKAICSAESEDDDISTIAEQRFVIVSYQKLKGIWADRFFPIIMYFSSPKDIYAQFEYDEIELPTYSEIRVSGLNSKRCRVAYLEKILNDINLDHDAQAVINLLKDANYKRPHKEFPKQPVEIHVACAAFDENGLLFIHKHERRGWEFGCVKILSISDTWKNTITQGYKNKYSMSIDVDENPIPIATYVYQKYKNKTALGLIVLGRFISNEKQSDFVGKTLEEIESIHEENMVNDFKINVRKAFEIHEKLSLLAKKFS